MPAVRFMVTIDGVEHEVRSTPFDEDRLEVWLLEKHGSRSAIDPETLPIRRTQVYLAWSACERKGLTDLGFDAFLREVEGVEEVEPVPLAGAAAASSPPQLSRAVRRATSKGSTVTSSQRSRKR